MLLTKHKEENFANIARGWACSSRAARWSAPAPTTTAPPACERHVDKALGLDDTLSKFHCRVFWLDQKRAMHRPTTGAASPGCSRWATAAGSASPASSSWDRIDDGSALLAAICRTILPATSPTSAAAGATSPAKSWLHCPGVTHLDLIDAEHLALEAARANITDHARPSTGSISSREPAPALYDAIVCNPPFHTGRAATPALGQAFIEAAARALKAGGRLLHGRQSRPALRADAASTRFAAFEMLADNNKFRVWRAVR